MSCQPMDFCPHAKRLLRKEEGRWFSHKREALQIIIFASRYIYGYNTCHPIFSYGSNDAGSDHALRYRGGSLENYSHEWGSGTDFTGTTTG